MLTARVKACFPNIKTDTISMLNNKIMSGRKTFLQLHKILKAEKVHLIKIKMMDKKWPITKDWDCKLQYLK